MIANDEGEVERILKEAGFWNNPNDWRPYGDLDNNYGTIGNQQSEAVAALVEKIVNAIDARLMNECLMRGESPESPEAPGSIREAVHRYFSEGGPFDPDRSGRLSNWRDNKLNQEGDYITVTATGRRPESRRSAAAYPCITIADKGEGQTPEDFPATFLSLHKSNKVRINFVQGKFNMGATGALPYCSERHNFQLIVSRRNPKFLGSSGNGRASEWGFTIVRRRDPSDDSRSSVFEYLAPVISNEGGLPGVLSFAADTFPIFPDRSGQPYSRPSEHGSLIKLYEYRWQGTRSSIIMPGDGNGLIRRIELALAEPALPVKLYECRSYQSNEVFRSMRGIITDLERNSNDIEEGFPKSLDLAVLQQRFKVLIYAFKPGAYQSHRTSRHGALFLYNGQMHASYTTRFFQRQSVKKGYLANDLLVTVDCSGIERREFEDLFMNSRDRLRTDSKLSLEIEKRLETFLLHDESLRSLEKQRHDAATVEKNGDASREKLLKEILTKNPEITRYLLEGALLTRTGRGPRPDKNGHFEGKQFPTFFDPSRKEWNVGVGNRVQLQFQTDAENSYFTRSRSPGSWSIVANDGGDWTNYWDRTGPNDGIARFYWDTNSLPPSLIKPGDSFDFIVAVDDESRPTPLSNAVRVNIIDPKDGINGGGGTRRTGGTDAVSPPKVYFVYEEEWASHALGAFNGQTACRIAADANDEPSRQAWEFHVNMDNEYIHHFARAKEFSLEACRQSFCTATVFLGLSIIRGFSVDQIGNDEEKESFEDLPEYVFRITQYIAPVLLPVIDSLAVLGRD